MEKVLSEAVKKLSPSSAERKKAEQKTAEILEMLNQQLENARAVLGGSGAKDTWLAGEFDIDIFIKFDYEKYSERSSELSDILEKVVKRCFRKYARIKGSRDYFQIEDENRMFEIIPVLGIKNIREAKNVTDASPLHAAWVKSKLKAKLSDEIRLAKAFCKAADIYGAESYVQGFSGYVCEILTIHYGSFRSLLKAALKWKEGEIIDPEGHYKKGDVEKSLNKSKVSGPLIIIDPVQPDRNAAAALSSEKFHNFRLAAEEFLKKPSISFFEKRIFTEESLKKDFKGRNLIILKATPKENKPDVMGSKLRKAFHYIEKQLKLNDFELEEADWDWSPGEEGLFWFVIKNMELSEEKELSGPPLFIKQHAEIFKKKYKKTLLRDNRLYAVVKRKFINAKKLIESLLEDKYIKEKVKKISIAG